MLHNPTHTSQQRNKTNTKKMTPLNFLYFHHFSPYFSLGEEGKKGEKRKTAAIFRHPSRHKMHVATESSCAQPRH